MATNPWNVEQDQQLRDLHALGLSLTVCATRMGQTNTRVSRHAKRIGLTWDRSKTKAATDARVADNKAMRSQLESGLLADATKLRAQLFVPCKVFNFGGKDNTYEERTVDQPPFVDQLKIMQAATIAVDRSLKIAVHDSDSSHDQAKSMLTDLAFQLSAAWESGKIGPTERPPDA